MRVLVKLLTIQKVWLNERHFTHACRILLKQTWTDVCFNWDDGDSKINLYQGVVLSFMKLRIDKTVTWSIIKFTASGKQKDYNIFVLLVTINLIFSYTN